MVLLDKLSDYWPSSEKGAEGLAQSCMKHWARVENEAGFLSWESFCSGLRGAIRAENASDRVKLGKSNSSDVSKADNVYVTTERMEAMLSKCDRPKLLEALIRSRKEVYSQYQALQLLSSPSRNEHTLLRAAGALKPGTNRSATISRSSSFSGSRTSHSSTSNALATANPGMSANLAILAEVESMLKDKLTHPNQCNTKVPLLQEALQQLRTLVQSLDLGPEQSQASAIQPRKVRVPAGTKPASLLVPSVSTHPASLILPSKSEPHNIGAVVPNSHSFSPKKYAHPASQPMRVDRSISHPAVIIKSPSSSNPTSTHSPKADLVPSTANPILTDYPRMRAALSLSSLPTSHEPSLNPNPTRSMLEHWKNSQLMQSGTRGNSGLQNMPTSQRASTPQLHQGPRAVQQFQSPSHPHAVVEFPPATPNNQHTLSNSKHFSQQYLSSPNLTSGPTEEALQQQQYGTISRGKRNLSQALNEQSAQIHRLQSEKEALIRHLFHQQAQGHSSADDSVMSVL